MDALQVHQDIRQSDTLATSFYTDNAYFEDSKEKIFARTWQYVADASLVKENLSVYPFTFLPGVLDEPLVLSRNKDGVLYCLSNVCTHRGKIIVEKPGKMRMLSCGYHGRCFRLDGSFKSMSEFEETANFPSERDHLTKVAVKEWAGMIFVSLDPIVSFESLFEPVIERLNYLDLEQMTFDQKSSKNYEVNAHWALYCDNYLEGFHIPFVHPALNQALEFEKYDYELFKYCNLQLGIGKEGEPCFDIPEGHPDHGKLVYAYYYWIFPNILLNFYPWGLSLNVVQARSKDHTKVVFRTYLFDSNKKNWDANRIDETEIEDEAVVESVQLGVRSRFYNKGRFSPTMEKGVHHFHEMISTFMQ